MLTLEHDLGGGNCSGRWLLRGPSGETQVISGKRAALLSLLLSGMNYELRPDVHPLDLFTDESLEHGRATVGDGV